MQLLDGLKETGRYWKKEITLCGGLGVEEALDLL
jgi:hypothetical protein